MEVHEETTPPPPPEPPPNHKRKRPDRTAALLRRNETTISTVKVGLRSVLHTDLLIPIIDDMVARTTQARCEAWMLASTYLAETPDVAFFQDDNIITQTFFNRCLCAVTTLKGKHTPTDTHADIDPHLASAHTMYERVRACTTIPKVSRNYLKQEFAYISKEMLTNMKNHVGTNLENFVYRRAFARVESCHNGSGSAITTLANQVMKSMIYGGPTVAGYENMAQWAEDLLTPAGVKLSKAHGTPHIEEKHMGAHWCRYFPFFREILRELEAIAVANPKFPPKLFALAPQRSFGAVYITIDNVVLRELLLQLPDPAPSDCTGNSLWPTPESNLKEFVANSKAHWDAHFNFKTLITKNRKQGPSFKTNGVCACVALTIEGKRSDDVPYANEVVSKTQPVMCKPGLKIVSIDPGRTALAACEISVVDKNGVLPTCRMHSIHNSQERAAESKRYKNVERLGSVSNAAFWFAAGYKRRAKIMAKITTNAHPHVAEMVNVPSAKTATISRILANIVYTLPRMRACLDFRMQRKVRRLDQQAHIRKQQALSDVAWSMVYDEKFGTTGNRKWHRGKRLRKRQRHKDIQRALAARGFVRTQDGSDKAEVHTIIGFGDAKFSSTSKGSCPGPVKTLRSSLSHLPGVRVVQVDEYMTSQVCSKCHVRGLKGPLGRPKPPNAMGVVRRYPIHGVRVCNHCHTTMNRDFTSARNIKCAAISALTTGTRPAHLCDAKWYVRVSAMQKKADAGEAKRLKMMTTKASPMDCETSVQEFGASPPQPNMGSN